MANELSSLTIRCEKLGAVQEVAEFLKDIRNAYDNLYVFELVVDSLASQREFQFRRSDEWFHRWRMLWKEFGSRKDAPPPDPFLFEILYNEYFLGKGPFLRKDLAETVRSLDFSTLILPSDVLRISKVNIQSPGFWEFIGSLNPLQQLREYLKDRHERSKDDRYRSRQEEELAELEIVEKRDSILAKRIGILRDLGYTEAEIRQLVSSMVIHPLNKLGKHQDDGRIDGAE